MKIVIATGETVMTLVLYILYLGKRMGTPLLKDGIRSLEAFPDPDETDCGSDWPGF